MDPGPSPASLNPVPHSLLDQFLQELTDLGLNERQVEGHLVYLRLWQKFLHPQKLLNATPEDMPGFAAFLREAGIKASEVQFAEEAIEHFYAFTLDWHPTWSEREAWAAHMRTPPPVKGAGLWKAITRKIAPHLKRVDQGLLAWEEP